ncbi:MAG TPA: hypothetical protein VEF72_05740 [Mycobacterium sp.]|nr:hypothetical protein [Mycobacterium sp.]
MTPPPDYPAAQRASRGAVIYGPALTDRCSLLNGPARVRIY